MGAGYCPWGGHTDWNGCNIHGEVHLRSGTFSKFGTLPATMATCQYWETFLEEAPCPPTTFGKMPKIVGMLPKLPKSTPYDPPWSWSDPYLTSGPKIDPENAVFCGFWTLTSDRWPWFAKNRHAVTDVQIHAKNQVHWSIGCNSRGGYTWTDRRNHRPLLWIVVVHNVTGKIETKIIRVPWIFQKT